MTEAGILALAFGLDLLIGDPAWMPHPVRWIGSAITGIERKLRRVTASPAGERLAGVVLVALIVLPAYGLTATVVDLLGSLTGAGAVLGMALVVLLAATTLATRELLRSAGRVIDAVRQGDLTDARTQVSMIVGRDTAKLDEQGVLRAAIETLAENLSDGIVAPLFYFAVGGLPLAMAYKAVNTLDSMVGYRNDRYRFFGWAAARLDDAANFIPARLSGLLIVCAVLLRGAPRQAAQAWTVLLRDGRNHSSPNSGVPEAAMAGALGVLLGGPNSYGGVLVEKPYIGDALRGDHAAAAGEARDIVLLASALAVLLAIGAIILRGGA